MKKRFYYTLLAFLFVLQAPAQNRASYTYDANNQLTQVVYSNGTAVKYTYDALGNRLSKQVVATSVTNQYTLSLSVSPAEGGRVTGAGTYPQGTSVNIKATANEGYIFSKWSDGDTNASRTIELTKNMSLTAYFSKIDVINQYTVTLSANPAEGGRVYGGGTFEEGEYTQLTSTANPGYTFTGWSDGNTNSKRSYEVTKDVNLVAYFSKNSDTTGLLGDVNKDGLVNVDDVTFIRNAYMSNTLDDSNCDLDGDGLFNIVDVTIMNAIMNNTYGGGDNPETFEPEISNDIAFTTAPYIWSDSKIEVTKLIKGNTYKVYYKIQNVSSDIWEGDLYLLANTDTVKVWKDRDYDPAGKANINATYVPQSTGTVRFALFCQPTGSRKGMLISEVGYPSNPMTAEVVDKAPSQGTYRGYGYVNLGLPSGTLWASYNLGANKPEGYGIHYAWGETVGCDVKEEFHPKNYKYYDYNSGLYTKYYVEVDEEIVHGIPDGLTQLLPEDDAATVNWGGSWRMPTYQERDELMNASYTTWTCITVNGVVGYKVQSIVPGYEDNSIFLPIAGYCHGSEKDDKIGEKAYYLTSSLYTSDPQYVNFLSLTPDRFSKGNTSKHQGSSVRPVVSTSDTK